MSVEDHRVARVVAACVSCRVLKRRGQVVDNLAFALVAPLRADNDDRFCSRLVRHFRYPPFIRPHPPHFVSIDKHYRRACVLGHKT